MIFRNTPQHYGWISIALHWFMALFIFVMFGLGLWMTTLDYYHPWYHQAPEIHKGIGILLLLLLCFRLVWRWLNARPVLLGLPWEKNIALLVHRLHYMVMLTVMVTGYLIPTATGQAMDVFGWFSIPSLITLDQLAIKIIGHLHLWTAWAMIGLAFLHAGAAFKHHLIDRDATLLRMCGLNKKS